MVGEIARLLQISGIVNSLGLNSLEDDFINEIRKGSISDFKADGIELWSAKRSLI